MLVWPMPLDILSCTACSSIRFLCLLPLAANLRQVTICNCLEPELLEGLLTFLSLSCRPGRQEHQSVVYRLGAWSCTLASKLQHGGGTFTSPYMPCLGPQKASCCLCMPSPEPVDPSCCWSEADGSCQLRKMVHTNICFQVAEGQLSLLAPFLGSLHRAIFVAVFREIPVAYIAW